MNRRSSILLSMLGCVLGSLPLLEFGPLASQAVAQRDEQDEADESRRDNEGDRSRGGRRGGWRRFRGEGGTDEERRERFRRLNSDRENSDNTDNGNNDEDGDRRQDDRDSENRDSERRDRENRDNDDGPRFDPADYARTLVKELDKNGNGVIDGEELQALRGPAATADLNNDKAITAEELTARLSDRGSRESNRGPTRPTEQSSGTGNGGSAASTAGKPTRVYMGTSGGASKDDKANTRRTYRFTPAGERLTAGLPSWFKSRDRNRDGQVAMSEYSRLWSQRMVNEFRRYDLNDDGVITPKEAAE